MDGTVAVRDVMDRSYVGLNEGDPVVGATQLMRREDVDTAVVLRGSETVGVLRARDVVSLVADGDDPGEVTVGEVMTEPVASIDVDARLDDALDAIAGQGLRQVVVTDGDDVAGILTEHDVVTAHAIRPGVVEPGDTTEKSTPGRESDMYGNQGVCEVCGSLTRDLVEHNGQLVCADCVEM